MDWSRAYVRWMERMEQECAELKRIRENIESLREHCRAHRPTLDNAPAPSNEPGLTRRENLEIVLIQLGRVSNCLAQLETGYQSLVCDVVEAETK